MDHFTIITGGPGSGKTTLLNALHQRGYLHSQEAGRHIIQDQVRIGGKALPWLDPAFFAELMLSWEMRSHLLASETAADKPYFFDRGMADIAGYLTLSGLPVPEHVHQAVQQYSYNKTVFIAPHWPEIYQGDTERKQSLQEAKRTFDAMAATYRAYGFTLLELPKAGVEARADFVLSQIV
ncbi:MAG: AAA family ATPase [Brucellaceae bacterium]|jgi:predicted ATPase|nr:AAA family ATPase [Brucellaceae bacterium]